MLEFVLNFLFPPACVICGKLNKDWLCENCKNKIQKYTKNKVVYLEENIKMLYIFEYLSIIRKLIIDYKFNDKAYINNFFSNFILNNKINCDILKEYDIIISVPLSKNKKMQRGYNQTDLIAKKISKELKIEYKPDILKKVKETKRQSSLSKEERQNNIKDAFLLNEKYNLKNKNLILLDDVYTTGSTIKECIKVLKKQEPKNIIVLILAKD